MLAEVEDLTREDYNLIRRLVYTKSGINLGEQKMQLVRARLGKRVRSGGFKSFREYYRHVEQDRGGEELCELLDAISTNTTHLFREPRHFNLLGELIAGWVADKAWRARHSSLRLWSAASSSGEEAHSIAMVAHDALRAHPSIQLKILATDISTQMLERAKQGFYQAHRAGTVPAQYKRRYLEPVQHEGQPGLRVIADLRRTISFSHFNLMAPTFPFRHGFDVIFCRNVMIYFDKLTQETLIKKLAAQLHDSGYLMIGHSESLNSIDHPLSYVEPTVYRKK